MIFLYQICQETSLLVLNLNLRNCEWTYFKSIKPLDETHCMLHAPKTLYIFYFHIHAMWSYSTVFPECNKVMLNVICHKAKKGSTYQSN